MLSEVYIITHLDEDIGLWIMWRYLFPMQRYNILRTFTTYDKTTYVSGFRRQNNKINIYLDN